MDNTKRTDYLFKAYKQQIELGSYSGSHEIFTPLKLVNEMIDQIPALHSKESFLVMYNIEFAISLISDYDIPSNRIYIYVDHNAKDCLAHKMQLNVVKSLEDITMKFDVILGNPPYNGKAALHQQFFNKGVELLNDNGTICFIQPATPYFNKKDKKKKPEKEMIDNIKKYHTRVKFSGNESFDNAAIATELAITLLIKTNDANGVSHVEYIDGSSYNHVDIENINMMRIDPEKYNSIRLKYENYVQLHGCLEDVVSKDVNVYKANLSKLRGHGSSNPDFYTFIPIDQSDRIEPDKDFGIIAGDENEIHNIYDYLRSYVARMGLALIKFNTNQHMREFPLVPLVDFSRRYTDQELYDMIGLTNDEVIVINSVISNYYDR